MGEGIKGSSVLVGKGIKGSSVLVRVVMNYVTMLVISDLSIFAYLSYHILC